MRDKKNFLNPKNENSLGFSTSSQRTAELNSVGNKKEKFSERRAMLSILEDLEEANKKLKESERKYQNLADSALVGIVQSSLKGDILYVNDALTKMYEFPSKKEFLSAKAPMLYKNPKDREIMINNLKKNRKLESYEIDMLTKKGRTITVLTSIILSNDKISATIVDITERKKAEEDIFRLNEIINRVRKINQLILREKNQKKLIDYASKMISSKKGFSCVFIALLGKEENLAIKNVCAVSKEHFSEKQLQKIHNQKYIEEVLHKKIVIINDATMSPYKQHFTKNPSHCAAALSLHHDNNNYGVLTVHFPPGKICTKEEVSLLKELAGDLSYALFSLEMEEEKKKAEKEVIEEKKFSENILSTMSEGVDIVDENLNIIYMNDVFLKAFGKEAIGKKCYEVYKIDKKQCEKCPLKKPIKIGETKSLIVPGIVGNKTFEITHTGINLPNGKKGILEVFRDITKEKEAEDALKNLNKELEQRVNQRTIELKKANEELKILDRAKDEFVLLASHELKSPLFPITGYIELMINGELGKITEEQKEKLNIMHKNAKDLEKLIEDMLELSRLELKKLELDINKNDIVAIANQVKESLFPLAESNYAKISIKSPEKLLADCDEYMINQIITNIVKNSIMYRKPGKPNKIEINIMKTETDAVISITDEGRGVPKEKQNKIFEKFYRIKEAVKRPEEGAGVGLSIVKGLVELHGGKISFKSRKGVGSALTFNIPLKKLKGGKNE